MTSDLITGIVKRALEAGHSIELEGLGIFRRRAGAAPGYAFRPETTAHVFVAYAVEDLTQVRRLCAALRARGCSPWLDRDKLLPGQNWPRAIERAIEVSDAFVACFSRRSTGKRGQFQGELRYALECARRRPLEQAYFIPVRLEECVVPRRVSEQVQYVDLFPDWDRGVRRIARSIRKAVRGRPVVELAASLE